MLILLVYLYYNHHEKERYLISDMQRRFYLRHVRCAGREKSIPVFRRGFLYLGAFFLDCLQAQQERSRAALS